jgi:hypothetical protein
VCHATRDGIRLLNPDTLAVSARLIGYSGSVVCLCVAPQTGLIVAACSDGLIHMWRVRPQASVR